MSEKKIFSVSDTLKILNSKFVGRKILHFDKVTSTFDKANEVELSDGLVIVANEQTQGKGRLGRKWESAKGGLYFSIILSAKHFIPDIQFSTIICALGVQKAIEKNVDCLIKWPNDIISKDGKKLCGILTKAVFTDGNAEYINVGIGINANNSYFPDDLPYASSIKNIISNEVDENRLMCNIFESIEDCIMSDKTKIPEDYSGRCVTISSRVRAIYAQTGESFTGLCTGINNDGSLNIQKENSEVVAVNSGEVSVRGIYGENYV